jgi:demethylmenaquinone methyltransferase/2-methoxy-6-polyprenyl-1,4-benzoquinol methylase
MTTPHPLQTYYSRIHKTYDLVNRLFTFGLDRKWRSYTVKVCLESHPAVILDLCCGTGDLAIALCKNTGGQIQVTGFDLNPEMLTIARQKATRMKAYSVAFIQGDAGSMPFNDGAFDCVTIGFGFRNLTWENPHRDKHIGEIARVMKPGARLLILESARPENKLIAFFYNLYLKLLLVPLGGLLSGDWQAYRYLAGSSSGFYSFDQLRELLHPYHLDLHRHRTFLSGSVNLLIASKKGS